MVTWERISRVVCTDLAANVSVGKGPQYLRLWVSTKVSRAVEKAAGDHLISFSPTVDAMAQGRTFRCWVWLMDTLAVALALVSDAWFAVEHPQSWGSACKCTQNAGNSNFWGTRQPAVVVTLVPRHGHRQSSYGIIVWCT